MRWLRRILVALLVLVIVLALAGIWMSRRSFPAVSGEAVLSGLDGPVSITRDTDGIPHIRARTTHDLFMAQGYVHAQDRFWQMDTWRHIGAGRVSEMFGADQVDSDAFLRTLGFTRLAEQEYQSAPAELQAGLDAYAAGVNAYLDERRGGSALSLEYSVLGLQNGDYAPEPWKPTDTLTWAHVMAWDLRSNMDEEIDRAILSGIVGRDRTSQLYPPYPDDHPVIVPAGVGAQSAALPPAPPGATAALERVKNELRALEAHLGKPIDGIGSNNWVVDGTHTASGEPLLANDPHLGIQLPSIWYEIDLWCEQVNPDCPYRVTGFSFPGAPGVVIGHNQHIAWGFTNEAPDAMDLYIEHTDGKGRYEVDGEWRDFDVRHETIKVAGGDDVDLEIDSTRHGPVISGRFGRLDDLDNGGIDLPDSYAIALRWRALEPSTVFQALLGFDTATNWDEFRRAAADFDMAPQNVVYADRDGNIGYQATGEIPIRRSGDGRYPAPGWTSDYEWDGYIPFDDLPRIFNPDSGVIVTANQPVVDSSYPYFIGIDHDYGYRAMRINDLLATSSALQPADMVAIQMDDYDASAAAVVPKVMELASDDPAIAAMQQVLGPWSAGTEPYQMAADSPGAAAYAAVWRHLLADTFDDELPEDMQAAGGSRFFQVVANLLQAPDDPWWDDVDTDRKETAPDILSRAVVEAHTELMETLGRDPASWRWGDLHVGSFENQTVGQSGIGLIDALFNRTAKPEISGGSSIVNATGWVAPDGYGLVALPSMRMVVDLSDLSQSVSVNTTGQSGHAYNRHYFDLNHAWATGSTHPMRFGPDSVSDPEGVLELVPG
ncbi:MAG: penicillin acylase family protein [Acidimicrobiia bacterium]